MSSCQQKIIIVRIGIRKLCLPSNVDQYPLHLKQLTQRKKKDCFTQPVQGENVLQLLSLTGVYESNKYIRGEGGGIIVLPLRWQWRSVCV